MSNGGPLILLVNHDQAALSLMSEQLSTRGCAVRTSQNSIEALKMARELHPDVVVASMSLSDLDGLQLSRVLQSSLYQNGSKPIPVILTTSGQRDHMPSEFARLVHVHAFAHPTRDFDQLYALIISAARTSTSKQPDYLARALLISRDHSGVEMLRTALQPSGWHLNIVDGPSGARDALENEQFEVVIFDGDTSNGWTVEFIKQLRLLSPETVVIGMSSETTEDQVIRLMQFGADDYLFKPVNANAANTVCFNALSRHSSLRIHRQFQTKLEELRDMSDYLDTVIRYSQEAIFSCDLVGHVRIWNKGAERMYGYTIEEIVGGVVDDFLDPTEFTRKSPDVVRILQQRSGSFVEPEIMRRRKNGDLFAVHATYSAIIDPSGQYIGFSVIERDVGTQKALEAEKIKSARLRAITQTAVTANDQINTPLGVILGYAQFLQRKMHNIAPEDVAALEIIQQQVLKIKGIMNKLKLMSDPIVKNYSIEGVTMLDLTQSK